MNEIGKHEHRGKSSQGNINETLVLDAVRI